MQKPSKLITVFEHQVLKLDQEYDGVRFDVAQLKALQTFYGNKGVPYFSLVHNGVKFNEYVGVLQVGNLTIEVLPKADKNENKNQWHQMLLGMLRVAGIFDIQAPSTSNLNLQSNSILDLYFALFLEEVEYLLHRGLVKKYRKITANTTALKGSIQFAQHLQKNLVHQERFYVRHTTYDVQHQLHQILYKALLLLQQINTNAALNSKIGALLLNFPEQADLNVSEITFDKIIYNRKNESYRKAVDIARLLLLNYHPDVSKGRNHVLALLFDMNLLWERFVYATLRQKFKKYRSEITITAQTFKYFWKPDGGHRQKIIPDIVIHNQKEDWCFVLDTKWKNLNHHQPAPEDLRQLYVYQKYYRANKVALIYPGVEQYVSTGKYLNRYTGEETNKECSIISLSVENTIGAWQQSIYSTVKSWLFLSEDNSANA